MNNATILTATYSRNFDRVVVRFLDNDETCISFIGNISDEEIAGIVAAGGGNVKGWESSIA